ncbi:MAG: hypothetical protein JHC37_05935 [Campylobacteraceae bacterium]|nr:hypothetical protein [Campylobacteraceae bacterium]
MRLVKLSMVFYKGEGSVVDKMIRFWTKSPLSHSEIETLDGYYCSNDPKTRVMRLAKITPKKEEWEECQIVLPLEIARTLHSYQLGKCGTKYDWEGILFSQFFKLGISAKKRWFCSKSNLDDMQTAIKMMRAQNRDSRYDVFLAAYEPFMRYAPQNVSPAKLHLLACECEKRLRGYNLLD